MKTYKFRLYPSKQIGQKMLDTLELCRQTYNMLLGGTAMQVYELCIGETRSPM